MHMIRATGGRSPRVESRMRMLKKRECGYADAAYLHTGRIVYCIKEDAADEYRIGQWKRRSPAALTRLHSDTRACASESNLHLR